MWSPRQWNIVCWTMQHTRNVQKKTFLVHRDEWNNCRVLRITRVSSVHSTVRWTGTCQIRSCSRDSSGQSCRIFPRDPFFGHWVTQDQHDPGFASFTYVLCAVLTNTPNSWPSECLCRIFCDGPSQETLWRVGQRASQVSLLQESIQTQDFYSPVSHDLSGHRQW